MRKLNYKALMRKNPTVLASLTNSKGQEYDLLENPVLGEDAPVIAIFRDKEAAFETDFWDTADFHAGSDYEPVLLEDGACVCKYETEVCNNG